MYNKAKYAVEKFNMLEFGDNVVAGVSGGADSMAMLKFLLSIKDEYNLNITVAHINHGLRGAEADRDENYVIDFCGKNNIAYKVLHADINKMARESGEGTEECGRRVRYEFFNSICKNAKIATAHTASDNAETVLFNLTRGSSIKGICGIPPVRDNIIRPLIFCTREEIEEYCRENEISFVTDSTNLGTDYTRNKFRHIVIPALEKINPSFTDSVSRLSQSAILDEALLEDLTDKLLTNAKTQNGYRADVILSSHEALQQRAVMKILKEKTPEQADNKRVLMILDILKTNGKIQLTKELFAICENNIFDIKEERQSFEPWSEEVKDFYDFSVKVGTKNISIKEINSNFLLNTQKIHKELLDYSIDCDTIKGKVYIGSRLDGDKISLPRRKCTKTLKKLFNEMHIPAQLRNSVAVLRDSEGVLWVEGLGADKRARVTESTKRLLQINLGGKDNEK